MTLSHRYVIPIVLLALTGIYAATALTYGPETRTMPLAIAGVLAALIIIDIVMQTQTGLGKLLRNMLAGSGDIPKLPDVGAASVRNEFAAFAWIIGFLVLSIVLGFYLAIPIYVFGYLRFHAGKSLIVSIIPAIAVMGLLYLLFQVMLGYGIFAGLIMGDFF